MGKQVKVVVSTPTNYRPATGQMPPPPPGVKAGTAPDVAPDQNTVVTGKGPTAKAQDGHPPAPPLAAQPPSNGSTNPIENGPSVDYDTQQGSRVPADIVHHPNAVIPMGEQDQRT